MLVIVEASVWSAQVFDLKIQKNPQPLPPHMLGLVVLPAWYGSASLSDYPSMLHSDSSV